MSFAPQAPAEPIEQGRDAAHHVAGSVRPGNGGLPPALEALEQLARRELVRLQAAQAPEADGDEVMLALAWDLGLAGDEVLS
jgi:RNA-binding protein YhbY